MPRRRFRTLPLSEHRFPAPRAGLRFRLPTRRLIAHVRPYRVRHPTDWSLPVDCSPPRLAATQLSLGTGRRAYARRGLPPLERPRRPRHSQPPSPQRLRKKLGLKSEMAMKVWGAGQLLYQSRGAGNRVPLLAEGRSNRQIPGPGIREREELPDLPAPFACGLPVSLSSASLLSPTK